MFIAASTSFIPPKESTIERDTNLIRQKQDIIEARTSPKQANETAMEGGVSLIGSKQTFIVAGRTSDEIRKSGTALELFDTAGAQNHRCLCPNLCALCASL